MTVIIKISNVWKDAGSGNITDMIGQHILNNPSFDLNTNNLFPKIIGNIHIRIVITIDISHRNAKPKSISLE